MRKEIYNSDFRDLTINPGMYDHIITDPPYVQGGQYGRSQLGHREIEGDKDHNLLSDFAHFAWRVLKDNSFCAMFCQWRTDEELRNVMREQGFELRTVAVWDKLQPGLGQGLSEQYEQINIFMKGKPKAQKFRGNVFRYPRINGRPDHPNAKPVDLMRDLIITLTAKGEDIFDGFAGTGAIPVACVKEKRGIVASEIVQKNVYLMEAKLNDEIKRQKVEPNLFE